MKDLNASTLDIRNGLQRLIEMAPAGGLWTNAETQVNDRNSLCLRVEPDGPIFTIRVEYGGALRVS